MMRLLRFACLVSLAAIFTSCATKPSPALQHVQNAPDPVEATLRANEHLRNSLFLIRSHGPSAQTPDQCSALLIPLADASEACAKAYKELLKIDTITAAQRPKLEKSFARLRDCNKLCTPSLRALDRRSANYIYSNDISYSGQRAVFWTGEAFHLAKKISKKNTPS